MCAQGRFKTWNTHIIFVIKLLGPVRVHAPNTTSFTGFFKTVFSGSGVASVEKCCTG